MKSRLTRSLEQWSNFVGCCCDRHAPSIAGRPLNGRSFFCFLFCFLLRPWPEGRKVLAKKKKKKKKKRTVKRRLVLASLFDLYVIVTRQLLRVWLYVSRTHNTTKQKTKQKTKTTKSNSMDPLLNNNSRLAPARWALVCLVIIHRLAAQIVVQLKL